jgi:hypothetical protein
MDEKSKKTTTAGIKVKNIRRRQPLRASRRIEASCDPENSKNKHEMGLDGRQPFMNTGKHNLRLRRRTCLPVWAYPTG